MLFEYVLLSVVDSEIAFDMIKWIYISLFVNVQFW